MASAYLSRPAPSSSCSLELHFGDGEDVRPAAAVHLQEGFTEALVLEPAGAGVAGEPVVVRPVGRRPLRVVAVVEQVLDVPEAEEITARLAGGRGGVRVVGF